MREEEGAELVCKTEARPWGRRREGDGPVAAPCWASRDPAGLARPPSRSARYLARPRDALYPLIDAESLGFVIQQLIVSIPPREAVRAWPFLSLCGPSGSWSVYTELQASKENLQPYHGIKDAVGLELGAGGWGVGQAGNGRWDLYLSCSFFRGDFWLHVEAGYFILSLLLCLLFLFEDFLSCLLG